MILRQRTGARDARNEDMHDTPSPHLSFHAHHALFQNDLTLGPQHIRPTREKREKVGSPVILPVFDNAFTMLSNRLSLPS